MKFRQCFLSIFSLLLAGCATDYPSLSKESFDEQPARIVKKVPFQDSDYDAKRRDEQESVGGGSPTVVDAVVVGLTVLAITGGRYVAYPLARSGGRETAYPPRFIYTLQLGDRSTMQLMEAYDIFKEGECVRLLRGQTSGLYRLAVGYKGACDAIPS